MHTLLPSNFYHLFQASGLRLVLVLIAIFFSSTCFSQKTNQQKKDTLSTKEVRLIYEKSYDKIITLLRNLEFLKEPDLTTIEIEQLSNNIKALFTDKAAIYSDLNADNVSFQSGPKLSLEVSTYITSFQNENGITGVVSDADFLNPEMSKPKYNGKTYVMRIAFNKKIVGNDRSNKPFVQTRQLATFFIEKSNGEINTLIQEISFPNPKQDYDFLSKSENEALSALLIDDLRRKLTGADSLFTRDEEAYNAAFNFITTELSRSQNLYDEHIGHAKKYIALKDYQKAANELSKAKLIQGQGSEYLTLNKDVEDQLEKKGQQLIKSMKVALGYMAYERVIALGEEARQIDVDNSYIQPLIEKANNGINRWNQLIGHGNGQNTDSYIAKLNTILNSETYLNQPDSLAEVNAALAYLYQKKNDKSSKTLFNQRINLALQQKSDFPKARLMQLEHEFSVEKAIQTYTDLLAIDSDNEDWYRARAKLYEEQKNLKLAAADLEKALVLKPLSKSLRKKLAHIYLQLPEKEKSLKHYKILKEIHPENLLSVFLTYAYLELNYPDSAQKEKNNYIHSSFPQLDSLATVYYNAALENMRHSAFQVAADIFDKLYILVGHQTDYSEYWYSAGDCHYKLLNFDKANEFLLHAFAVYPNYFEANLLKGKIHLKSKEYKEAQESFKKCLEIRKSDYEATKFLADAYFKEDKYISEANTYYSEALQIVDHAIKNEVYFLRVQLARCTRKMNKLDEAIAHCDEAIKIKPNHPDAYFEQGIALGKKDDDSSVKKGLKQIDKALEYSYKQSDCYRARAEIHLRIKKYTDALEELTKLERLEKFLGSDFVMRAKAYEGLSKHSEAFNDLNKAQIEDTSLLSDKNFLVQLSMVRIKFGVSSNLDQHIKDSKHTIKIAQDINREDPNVYLAYSVHYWYMKNEAESINNLNIAIEKGLKIEIASLDPFLKEFFKIPKIKQALKGK